MFEPVLWIVGFTVVMLLPGYLISLLMFRKLKEIDRILVSVGFSIAIVAILSLVLGGPFRMMTGGWNHMNVWLSYILIIFLLAGVLMIARIHRSTNRRRRSGRNSGR